MEDKPVNDEAAAPSEAPQEAREGSNEPATEQKAEAPQPKKEEPKKISIDKFFETELCVAQVISAEPVENADKLLKLRVSLGDEERQIVAGLAKAYEPAQLVGKRIVVVANLKPAKLRGVESQGMLLAADFEGRPVVATFDEDVAPGTKVR
ncbi:MAG: methionine--tRNA ligase subunit beta [bacterium]|nr:methionine--tRNA ligase subunit beta [bacterium]